MDLRDRVVGKFRGLLGAWVLPGLTFAAAQVAHAQGELKQAVEAFFSPSAAAFAADGRTLYIANAARGSHGMLAGRGAVSRTKVSDSGEVTVEARRWAEGLNGPLGVTVLRHAAGRFPAGTVVVSNGGRWIVDADGRPIDDEKERATGLVFLDANDGRELGRVYLGGGSPVAELLGRPVFDPTAVTADGAGNIFVADVAGSAINTVYGESSRAGVFRLTPAAVDALAAGEKPPEGSAAFAVVANLPTGLTYSIKDDALYWVTGDGIGDLGGAVFRLPRGDFSGVANLETVAKRLTSLAGVTITPNGTILAGRTQGDIIHLRDGRGRGRPVRFRPQHDFLAIGQIAATNLADGRVLVVVPELSGVGMGAWRQRVQTFTLPAEF